MKSRTDHIIKPVQAEYLDTLSHHVIGQAAEHLGLSRTVGLPRREHCSSKDLYLNGWQFVVSPLSRNTCENWD